MATTQVVGVAAVNVTVLLAILSICVQISHAQTG